MTETTAQSARRARLRAAFFLLLTLLIGAVLIVAMTWFVVGSAPRSLPLAVAEGVAVREFVALPGDDAYPAALALAQDGTVYTGSYKTGAVWAIDPAGAAREILAADEGIGSVSGLDMAAGALYILDRVAPLDAQGAVVWRYEAGRLEAIVNIPPSRRDGLMLPDDIAVARDGIIYISDRDPPRVLRYAPSQRRLDLFWQPDEASAAPTGLAYDSLRHALLVTDSANDAIFRVPVDAPAASERLFVDGDERGYGFDGIDVAADGEVYLALLGWNRAARLQNGELVMLARDFRGASDVALDAERARLYVTNWNQFSLGFGTSPQLPFSLNALELAGLELMPAGASES
ncbi:MAG: SMP-30/gluconolactonase/LRE family protein [Chloroflexi bacterium]|nr:SMP-30/gluconolactonase/LRE family protein [Chloroflexota bacterium]MCY4246795.1 SMP-30/gluconolactonase/LRE family protein [Chloroflexota bacterium]